MKYKNELKSVIAVGTPVLTGSITGYIVIPHILYKDNLAVMLEILGSFIGISLFSIVKFIEDINKSKKSTTN